MRFSHYLLWEIKPVGFTNAKMYCDMWWREREGERGKKAQIPAPGPFSFLSKQKRLLKFKQARQREACDCVFSVKAGILQRKPAQLPHGTLTTGNMRRVPISLSNTPQSLHNPRGKHWLFHDYYLWICLFSFLLYICFSYLPSIAQLQITIKRTNSASLTLAEAGLFIADSQNTEGIDAPIVHKDFEENTHLSK